ELVDEPARIGDVGKHHRGCPGHGRQPVTGRLIEEPWIVPPSAATRATSIGSTGGLDRAMTRRPGSLFMDAPESPSAARNAVISTAGGNRRVGTALICVRTAWRPPSVSSDG